jgi:hypothetical protein
MLRSTLLLFLLAMASIGSTQTIRSAYSPTLRSSCPGDSFLSISASAPTHDSFVSVELGLVDPQGRTAGTSRDGNTIPRSRYGKVAEIPTHPETSKAIAVEICGAIAGLYLISVSEHGDSDYRLTVTGDDGAKTNEGNQTQAVSLHTHGDRVCHFRFHFRIAKDKVEVHWVDEAGRPLSLGESPSCEQVPRA